MDLVGYAITSGISVRKQDAWASSNEVVTSLRESSSLSSGMFKPFRVRDYLLEDNLFFLCRTGTDHFIEPSVFVLCVWNVEKLLYSQLKFMSMELNCGTGSVCKIFDKIVENHFGGNLLLVRDYTSGNLWIRIPLLLTLIAAPFLIYSLAKNKTFCII